MKQHIIPALKLTFVALVFFTVIYPLIIWGVAQISPNAGEGHVIEQNGKKYYSNIGQSFTNDKYFWSRPSAVDYNAAGSGGSNKGPSNEAYLAEVYTRIDIFMLHNPNVNKANIPVDLITASGSGLDPDISVQAARIQVSRIAKIRQMEEAKLLELINIQTEKPFLGLLGPEKINVLKLNIALDNLKE